MSQRPEPETFTRERIAEFLLNNSLSEDEYRRNLAEVLAMGVNPLAIEEDCLERSEPWQRAENYPELLPARRTS